MLVMLSGFEPPMAASAYTASAITTTPSNISLAFDFFVLNRESGTVRDDLPAWTSKSEDPFRLLQSEPEITCSNPNSNTCELSLSSFQHSEVERRLVDDVPGTFQLLNILTKEECMAMVDTFDDLGFTDDAAVSLPKHIRHNTNLVWIADNSTLEALWDQRLKYHFWEPHQDQFMGRKPVGLNGRFRVYRYGENDYFKYHTDGSWPGTRVVRNSNGNEALYELVHNAFPNQAWSMYSMLLFLTDDFEGGETEFLVHPVDITQPADDISTARKMGVRTPVGGALCFPHGEHPLHCLHSSTPIKNGIKYIIRVDVLFDF
jgi:hypothetical protein